MAAMPDQVYPMTYEQEGLWLDDHLYAMPSRYLESWACRLSGQLDVSAVEWAIGQIVMRHEVLRSRLILQGNDLVQIVMPGHQVPLAQVSCTPSALPEELSRIVAEPLDLDRAPLRPWLIRISSEEYLLVVQFHHAVIDDWAFAIFEREFRELYTACVLRREPYLKPLSQQVGQYAVAQRAAGIDHADLAYWRTQVRGAPSSCTIPPDWPRPQSPRFRGRRHPFSLAWELTRLVSSVSRTMRTTPFTVFAAAMAALLAQESQNTEVIFGAPVSRRGAAAVSEMIGCMTDLLPIRLGVPLNTSFAALIGDARAAVLGALEHNAVPYAAVAREARRRPGADSLALCPTALVVDDAGWDKPPLPGLTTDAVYIPTGRSKFDLCVTLVRAGDGYLGFIDYAAELYRAETVARIASQFIHILGCGLYNYHEPLADALELIT